jgi:hypothetical protein
MLGHPSFSQAPVPLNCVKDPVARLGRSRTQPR